jgi:hypothetical protein
MKALVTQAVGRAKHMAVFAAYVGQSGVVEKVGRWLTTASYRPAQQWINPAEPPQVLVGTGDGFAVWWVVTAVGLTHS